MSRFVFLLCLCLIVSCHSNESLVDRYKLSEIEFKSVYGHSKSDSSVVLSVLADQSIYKKDNFTDSLLNDWLLKHKKGSLIPVSQKVSKNKTLVFCWLIENEDTANLYLVKHGCYTAKDMSNIEGYSKLLIDSQHLSSFNDKLKSAEDQAKTNKVGIWEESADSSVIRINVFLNDTFSFKLESNPSSGFTWEWKNRDKALLVKSADWNFKNDSGLTGGYGNENWYFIASNLGTEELIMEYRQPWDKETPAEEEKIFKITVLKKEDE